MSDSLKIWGTDYTGVNGFKAKDAQGNVHTYGTGGGTPTLQAKTVTPSVTNTAGYISGGTKTGNGVSVSASELVSGTLSIAANGTDIDVTNYEKVDVAVPTGSAKNIQVYSGYASRTANSYGATSVTLTVAKTGTYKITWMAWRSSSSGTMGTNLHKGSTAESTAHTTWTNTYGQCITLTNQSLTQGTVLTLYATSGSNSRTINVGNLIIEEE